MAAISESLRVIAGETKNASLSFSRASQGTRVNKIGQVETMAADEPRFDYYPAMGMIGIRRGYLLEEASTNMVLQSDDLSTTWTVTSATQTPRGSISANGTDFMSPNGAKHGDYLNCATDGTGIVAARQTGFSFTSGQKYTVSIYARKALGYDYLEISNLDASGTGMTFAKSFNLSTGAVGTASGGTVDASGMDEYAGGWYRCYVTFTADVDSSGELYYKARNDDAVNTETAHTTGNKIHLWGAQCEALPYMTSYVPTTTSAVTRAADVAVASNTDAFWNWNAGLTLWCDYIPLNTTETVTPIFHYADATNTNYMTLLSDGKVRVVSNSLSQLASDPFDAGISLVSKQQYRGLMAASLNNFHYASNGVLSSVLPDTTIDVPLKTASSNYSCKFFHGTGYSSGSGWLKAFEIYPQRMSDNNAKARSVEVNTDLSTIEISTLGTVADNTISEAKLMTGAVTATKIGASAVIESKIMDNAVTASKIAGDSVNGSHIADASIGEEHIIDNSITSAKIAFDVILADDIANNAITFAELQADAVQTTSILDLNVTRGKLENDAVDGSKLADDAVDSEHYTDLSIDNAHIAADAVDGSKLADDAVDSEHYTDLSIDEAHIADSAVTSAKIANFNVTVNELGSNSVSTLKVIDFNITEAKIGALAVTNGKIGALAVTEDKIADGSITAAKIANGTIIEQELADNSVTALKLADNAVDTNAIVDLNVTEGKLADGCVTNAKLGANSITSDKITFDIIVADDIADNAVTFAELADNAVRTAKIQDGAVTGTKIELTGNVEGDIMYYDSNGDWVVLHPSAGSYLQSNGAGAAPEWASSATLAIALG